jgi:hypothetical protein
VSEVGDALVGPVWGHDRLWALVETFAPEGRVDRSAVIGRGLRLAATVRPDGSLEAPVAGHGKLMRNQETGEETLYDLAEDPGERRPIEEPGAEWDPLREIVPAGRADRAVSLDPETERRLRALGYIH